MSTSSVVRRSPRSAPDGAPAPLPPVSLTRRLVPEELVRVRRLVDETTGLLAIDAEWGEQRWVAGSDADRVASSFSVTVSSPVRDVAPIDALGAAAAHARRLVGRLERYGWRARVRRGREFVRVDALIAGGGLRLVLERARAVLTITGNEVVVGAETARELLLGLWEVDADQVGPAR